MKMRYFLRGLGTGIVLTALILCIYYRQKTPEQTSTNIVQQAKELGMVFPEGTKTPEITRQPEPTEKMQKTPKPTDESAKTPKPTNESTKTPKPTAAPQETGKTKQKKGTRFTVRDGLLSSSVAREMKDAGIIRSDKALDEYMEKNGYASSIREGTYWIPEGASYEEIAKIITRKIK